MKWVLRIFGILTAIFIAVIAFLCVPNTQLATPINWILPKEWKVKIPQGLHLNWQGSSVSQFQLSYRDCPLISADKTDLTWIKQNHLFVEKLDIDYHCLSLFPKSENNSNTSLKALLAVIPDGEATIHSLNWKNLPENFNPRIIHLLEQQTALKISLFNAEIKATLAQQAVDFSAFFTNGKLNADLTYQPSKQEQHKLTLSAEIEDNFLTLPHTLSAEYYWQLPDEIITTKALQNGHSTLNWQKNAQQQFEGYWQASLSTENDKLNFPFLFDGKSLEIKQGRFDWSLTERFPLHGFVTAKVTPQSFTNKPFLPLKTAIRISLLSQNSLGKGNIVISNSEGEITEQGLNLPLRLTGNIKHGNFILYSSIPLDFQGNYDDLTLKFLPTSCFV